jgi:signal transduction histidine kinase
MPDKMFGPDVRLPKAEIFRQNILFGEFTEKFALLDAISEIVLILNSHRQIIFANEKLRKFLNLEHRSEIYGQRPGEILKCEHAFELPSGCGTSKFCTECGAAKAMKSSMAGIQCVEECRISTVNNESFDLRVTAVPIEFENEQFTIFTLNDISDEKRRLMLERIFFHDILNTASGIKGLSDIISTSVADESLNSILAQLSDRLIDEIKAQQELTLAENGQLQTLSEHLSSKELIMRIGETYKHHPLGEKKNIIFNTETEYFFESDKRLLQRVIGNMVKNALEATQVGGNVLITTRKVGHYIAFLVHNDSVIDAASQLKIFQRSFSTKGVNRGLGTYSIKLLTENFLSGRVGFVSNKERGTTFYAIYPEKLAIEN